MDFGCKVVSDEQPTWAGARVCVFGTGELGGDLPGNLPQRLLQVGAICTRHQRHQLGGGRR